jgi:lysophospholipase L1-like esterase
LARLAVAAILVAACTFAVSAQRPSSFAAPAASQSLDYAATSSRSVYVAIGASDSYGTGLDDPATQAWPAVFARSLPAGTHVINLGVPGILLHRAIITELPVALDAHPTVVTVWLAVNDLAGGVPLALYHHDLAMLLGSLHRSTHAPVLVANIPNLSLIPVFSGRPELAADVAAWNVEIAAAVRAHGAVLVDLYAHWRELARHPEYVGPDGLHPSAEGARRLAALFAQAYRASMRR